MKNKTNKVNNIDKVILHGEAMIFGAASIPKDAKPLPPSNTAFHIIADSETTGNHHVVDADEGVFFFVKDSTVYMKNTVETRVRCLHADRHSTTTIAPGLWEFGIQQEYDHVSEALRKARD